MGNCCGGVDRGAGTGNPISPREGAVVSDVVVLCQRGVVSSFCEWLAVGAFET